VALPDADGSTLKRDGRRSGHVPADWRERFGRTFDAEFQDWLKAVAAGTSTGPGSWDGYAATVVAESCLEALRTGSRTSVRMRERPDFYAKAQ
jgi:myo-inositol 2-dehydrogenase/D-chiro-inositol 1-dehydrogenase